MEVKLHFPEKKNSYHAYRNDVREPNHNLNGRKTNRNRKKINKVSEEFPEPISPCVILPIHGHVLRGKHKLLFFHKGLSDIRHTNLILKQTR